MATDFLNRHATTPISKSYLVAGAVCRLATNSSSVENAARESFLPTEGSEDRNDFIVRIWVDDSVEARPPWPKPYVRGLDHLVFAGFEPGSSMLIDLLGREVIGRFSPGMAADASYIKAVVFPMMLSILSSSIGVAELHCAGVVKSGTAFLLAGPSGSGKSTLSVALARLGFGFLSDDRTFCSLHEGRPLVWSTRADLKLRRDAGSWFEELKERSPADFHNGESVFRVDPESGLGLERVRRAVPGCLILLDRDQTSSFRLTKVSASVAVEFFENEMIVEFPEAVDARRKTLLALRGLPCWRLQYGEAPQQVAEELARHFSRLLHGTNGSSES